MLGDYSSKEQTEANVRDLIDRGFRLLLGPFGSGQSEYAARVVSESSDVLLMATAASKPTVFRGRPRVFGVFSPSNSYFDQAVAIAAARPGPKQAALLIEDHSVSRTWGKGARAALAKHDFELLQEASLPHQASDREVASLLGKWAADFPPDALPLVLAATYSVRTCIKVRISVHMSIHLSISMSVHVSMHMSMHMSAQVCTPLHATVYAQSICTPFYILVYTHVYCL